MRAKPQKQSSGNKLTLGVILCLVAAVALFSMNSVAEAFGFSDLWSSLRPVAFVVVGTAFAYAVFRLAIWLSRR